VAPFFLLACAACGASNPAPPAGAPQGGAAGTVQPPATPPPAAPPPLAPGQPLVELHAPGKAVVNGQEMTFDGVEEGLVWPGLDRVVPDETYAGAVVVRVDRAEPLKDVMRVVFTLREADLRLESQDGAGAARFVMVTKKPQQRKEGCRLAVFMGADGSLRVAAPGGPRELPAPDAVPHLVEALEGARTACPIRYVAFGMLDESHATFGPLFDLMLAVDQPKAAGDARYVLAEPVEPPRR
jgi:hypothetical protein